MMDHTRANEGISPPFLIGPANAIRLTKRLSLRIMIDQRPDIIKPRIDHFRGESVTITAVTMAWRGKYHRQCDSSGSLIVQRGKDLQWSVTSMECHSDSRAT
jgi:hypothetical protein